MSLGKKIILIFSAIILGALCAVTAVCALAYFSKKEIYDGYLSGEVELLFDRLNEQGFNKYKTAMNENGVIIDESLTHAIVQGQDKDGNDYWGTEAYPYVISDVRHLYNLSELQRLGYFDTRYIQEGKIPYFLVCDPDYTPKAIDGSNYRAIKPVGTEEYPFAGSVKGITSKTFYTYMDKQSDTSAIYNVKVSGNPKDPDIGLFGYVTCLITNADGTTSIGDAETIKNLTDGDTFSGTVSTISNLLLWDITVTADSSAFDAVTEFFEDIMAAANPNKGHKYLYSELYGTENYNKIPHENHHVGILAGHVSYTKVEYISVYYTDDNIAAIDLKDTTNINGTAANYHSATGIIGFLDNMNPTFENGVITAGSGDSNGDLSYGSIGGGGLLSGDKRGYVLAKDMYETYKYNGEGTADTTGTINISTAVDINGNPLCTEWIRDRLLGLSSIFGDAHTGRYYFYDGVFTFALSSTNDIIEPTWDIFTDDSGSVNYDIDSFYIGSNDPDAWEVDYTKGNKAAVAYIKKVTSDSDLQAAIQAGKQIFIMSEGQSLLLMSLYNQSTRDDSQSGFTNQYYTNGATQQFGNEEFVDSLIQSYEGGLLGNPDLWQGTTAELISALTDGKTNDLGLKAINVGITSSSLDIETLKSQYTITASNVADSYNYFYIDEATGTDVAVDVNTDGTINEFYIYPINQTGNYQGFFYYESTWYGSNKYYWCYIDGNGRPQTETLSTGTFTSPTNYFTASGGTWAGETIYTRNDYTGAVIYKDGNNYTFFGTRNTANADIDNVTLTKPSSSTIYYFYRNVGSDVYYHSLNPNISYTIDQLTQTDKTSLSGQPIYSAGNNIEGVLLERFPQYNFYTNGLDSSSSATTNYLRLIYAQWLISNGYVLWNGNDEQAENTSNFQGGLLGGNASSLQNTKNVSLRFNQDGTCYIQYVLNNSTYYVNADTTNGRFNTATSKNDAGARLCIYTVEGLADINYGRVTFVPKQTENSDGTITSDGYEFSTGDYVLVADKGTAVNGQTTSGNTYTVTSLTELGWNNKEGQTLSSKDLTKKFKMVKGITFGVTISLGGDLSTGGMITAPIGSEGIEANIPMACIAFKVNKITSSDGAKIRVIVAAARSDYYQNEMTNGQSVYDLGTYTRYFNLWEIEESGSSFLEIFQRDDYIERFIVPRSHPYEPGTMPSDTASEYVTVNYNNAAYRSYLNGSHVLIAYEFVVTSPGVYCLGMSGIDPNNSATEIEDVPMEIVYFSADGVASAGRDGLTGSQTGTIDFVYDYTQNSSTTIVTVTESSETDENGNENYSTYYPSYVLLYTDNGQQQNGVYVDINNEVIYIRRYVDEVTDPPNSSEGYNDTSAKSYIKLKLEGDKYIKLIQYSLVADNVVHVDGSASGA